MKPPFEALALSAAAMLPSRTLAATPSPVPASLYPTHTRITSMDPLAKAQMDCDWGFDCHQNQPVTAVPLFHERTQDELHRLSGWAQFGDSRKPATRMLFALFAPRYSATGEDGMPGNVAAFADFRGVLIADGYTDLERYPRLLPRGVLGNTSAQRATATNNDVLAMTCWTGSIEVEGVVVYVHHNAVQRRTAMRDLARQVRAGVHSLSGAG
jgi:hypothetical protein